MTARAILAAMHAELIAEAGRLERSARRADIQDADATQSADLAAEARERADALVAALEHMGGVYIHDDPRQIVLFQDGGQQA